MKKNNPIDISYNSIKIVEAIPIIIIYLIAIILVIIRFFHGIEITDEALYIAEGYIVTQEATPYVDMWSQTPGFALLNAPFAWLYVFLNGSTEGIVLYFRIISLLTKTVFICSAVYIIRPIVKSEVAVLWLLPIIAFTTHSIITLSYNIWVIMFLMLSGISLVRAVMSENQKERKIFGAAAGVFCALGVLCYPITIVTGCCLLVIAFGYEVFHSQKHHVSLNYLFAGFMAAILISLFFIIRTGEILGIIDGLKVIIYDNPYHQLSKNITKESITVMLSYYRNWLVFLFIFYIIYFIPITNKKTKANFVIIFIVFYILYNFHQMFYGNLQRTISSLSIPQITSVICRQLFFIPLLILPYLQKNRRGIGIALILFLYLPAFIHTMTASLLTHNGMNKRYYFLLQGVLLTIPFIYWMIIDNVKNCKISKILALLGATLCTSMFAAIFLLNYYGYMYRDDPMPKLDYKVESGIYKGLYTTKQRGEGIELLEKTIRSITNANEKILFMDNTPMAYLMTEAKHCAPSTWDIQSYTYGFKEDTLLRKYFERTGCTPDKIIYIFTGRDKILSIDSEDYKFNNYVNANYKLTSNIDAYYPIKIYERIAK